MKSKGKFRAARLIENQLAAPASQPSRPFGGPVARLAGTAPTPTPLSFWAGPARRLDPPGGLRRAIPLPLVQRPFLISGPKGAGA